MQGKNIILVIDGKSHTISKDTHIAFGKIVDALKAKDWATLRSYVEPVKAIVNFGKGYVSIEDNVVLWKNEPFHNALSNRMIEMFQDGFPIDPMIRFMENLMRNPSKRSVDQMYLFLEKNKLPITEDGYFLAYKRVNPKYFDIHTNSINNKIGQKPAMERNLVDDNPDSLCSSGLHFCSESYLDHFGCKSDPIMILKINPADVVSIPKDYNGAKGRCCLYEVVGEVSGDPASAFASIVNNDYSDPEVVLAPTSAWPFPTTKPEKVVTTKSLATSAKVPKSEQLYDLRRLHNSSVIEACNLTYSDALALVAKNIRLKKALLKIVKAGTNEEA